MNKEIFNQSHVFFDKTATTQDEAFKVIATLASELGYVADVDDYFVGLKEREEEATTGFKDQIAIPHSKNKLETRYVLSEVCPLHSLECLRWSTC